MTNVPGFPDFIPMMRSLERDDFSSNRHPALSFCLSMISAQTLRVCREGKPVPTFPDHALTDTAGAAIGFKPGLPNRLPRSALALWRLSQNYLRAATSA